MRKHPYEILLDRKRKWSPVKPTVGVIRDEARDTIGRALAARHLAVSYTHLTLPTIYSV